VSTHLNLGAMYATRDIYHHYINPRASEKRLVWVGRASTLLILLGSFVYGLMMESITSWLIFAIWIMSAGIWLPSILQVVWWRFNSWGYLSAWIANLGLSWLVVWILPGMGVLTGLADYHRFWILMVLGMVIYLPATFFTRPERMDKLVRYYAMSRPIGWWGPVRREAERRGLIFIFPTLILNFRREIFNSTARLLVEIATDVFPLTAYCESPDCVADAFCTYRYYLVDGEECPALYFDPLIIVGGDREKLDPREPNYCSRCDRHHYLPGKEYTFLVLKPLGERAAMSDPQPLREELGRMRYDMESSALYRHFEEVYAGDEGAAFLMRALRVPCIAEKALVFLYAEQNLLSRAQVEELIGELELDRKYIERRLRDNGRLWT